MSQAEEVAMRALKVKPGDMVSERKWLIAVDTATWALELLLDESLPAPNAPAPKAAPQQSARSVAKLKGYTGDTCPDCGNLSMVRNGTCLKCDDCGSTTGCS